MKLNMDFARCRGVGEVLEDDPRVISWREGCEDCLRRTLPGGGKNAPIEPPEIIAFECEYYISPVAGIQSSAIDSVGIQWRHSF